MNPSSPVRSGLAHLCTLLILLTTLLLTGCGGVNPSSETSTSSGIPVWTLDQGGVSGRVTIGSSSYSISGALLEAGGAQTVTASDGLYLLGPLAHGEYLVTARASGYGPQARSGVRVRAGLITDSIHFQMASGSATATRDFAIVALVPDSGTDGDEIDILGTGFGSVPGKVTIAGKEASISNWNSKNDGVIRIRLPPEVETGVARVYIGNEGSHEASPITFTGRPVALEVRPSGARPGQQVTIYGRNFHEVRSFNKVHLNGLACEVLPESTTRQLVIIVPSSAKTGLLRASIQSDRIQLDGISYATLTIPPELIYLTPQRSIPGVTLTLYGTNFGEDRTAVSVRLGDKQRLGPTDFLSFSNNKVTFAAPDNAILAPGQSVEVRLYVNEIPCSQPLTYTAYNQALNTMENYGIYRFSDVSSGNTLHLPKLAANETIAFLASLNGNGTSNLDGDFKYLITARLGGNASDVPSLPSASIARASMYPRHEVSHARYRDAGQQVRSWQKQASNWPPLRSSIRQAIGVNAPATGSFWLVNFASADPSDPANDELASATLLATGTNCLIYVDNATDTVLTASSAEKIAEWFDGIYSTLATACTDGITLIPEGNVDAQSRILLFVTPQINRGVSGSLVTLGYFNPRDKNAAQPHSNGTEILYLWDKAFDDPNNFKGILAHELQHMMYYNQKGPDGNQGSDWLDEGLSVWAQQVVGYGFPQAMSTPIQQVGAYLKAPHNTSLNHWNNDGLESYGMSYLFVQYLFERCGGYNAIRRLERKNGSIGLQDISSNILPLAATSPADLKDFMQQFGLAMYCDGIGLPTALPNHQPDLYQFTLFELRKGIAGINGLRHLSFDENPVTNREFGIKGYGFDILEYVGGNGGDLEWTLVGTPTPDFQIWVVYFQNTD